MSRGSLGRRVGVAAAIWVVAVLASRLTGFARNVAIGRLLGAGEEAGLYFAAFTVPDYINYLLAGGALSVTLIPLLHRARQRGGPALEERFFQVVLTMVLVASVVACGAAFLGAPVLARLAAPGFEPAALERLARLIRILLPAQVFHLIGGVLGAVQMVRDEHRFVAAGPVVYNLVILGVGVALAPALGAEGFCWGVALGACLAGGLLQAWGAHRLGVRWRCRLEPGLPLLRRFLLLTLPVVLAVSVVFVDEFVVKALASRLGADAVAWLMHGRNLMRIPMGLFGLALGAAAYPVLAELVAAGAVARLFDLLGRSLRALLLLALASALGLIVLRHELVYWVFGAANRRMSPADLSAIAASLALLALGLTAWIGQQLVARAYFACEDTLSSSVLGSYAILAFLPLYVLSADYAGYQGLALASTVAITVYWGLLLGGLGGAVVRAGRGVGPYSVRSILLRLGPVGPSLLLLWWRGLGDAWAVGAVSVVGWAGALGQLAALRRLERRDGAGGGRPGLGLGAALARLVPAALGVGVAGEAIRRALWWELADAPHWVGASVAPLLVGPFLLVAFAGLALLLGVEEVRYVLGRLVRRRRLGQDAAQSGG